MLTKEQIRRALDLLRKTGANREYFFGKAISADWIDPLEKEGLFRDPPAPVRSGSSISFSFWPESRYLARVASTAPERVARVIEMIPFTDNVRVHEDIVDAALKMPAHVAAKVVDNETTWLSQQSAFYFIVPDSLADLVVHLVQGGEEARGLRLLTEVLKLAPPQEGRGVGRGRLASWNYERILTRQFPDILKVVGTRALWLLCDVLARGMDSDGASQTFSSFWRPAIENHEQNRRIGDPADHLLEAIRDGLLAQLYSRPGDAGTVSARLDSLGGELFRRLAIHLADAVRDVAPESACERLLRREDFVNPGVHHEYSLLMRHVFPILKTEQRTIIIQWIVNDGRASPDADTDAREMAEYRMFRRLSLISENLSSELAETYEQLVSRFGPVEHPDFLSYHSSWIGPVSPTGLDDLKAMTLADVAAYLRTWKAVDGWRSPTPEGLARELSRAVKDRAKEVASRLDLFVDIEPSYARAIVEGLGDALKEGAELCWKNVLRYMTWIVIQDRTVTYDSKRTLDRDPHWGWARKAVARTIETALRKRLIDAQSAETLWTVLDPITTDPDPEPDHDVDGWGDVITRSINDTRPVAFHALMIAVKWLRDERERAATDEGRITLATVQRRALDVLDRHLDPAVDPSPSVRSVYGQYLEWMWSVDPSWVGARLALIFPEDRPRLWDAAWIGYLYEARLSNGLFERLRGQYERAISNLVSAEGEEKKGELRDARERLAEHLMILVARGIVGIGDPLLNRFFSGSSPETQAYAAGYVGRALNGDGRDIDDAAVGRWQALWDWRRGDAEHPLTPQERAEFGWWFASGRFDRHWVIERYIEALRASTGIVADPFIFGELERICAEQPLEVVQILECLVTRTDTRWSLLGLREHGETILRTCLADAGARPRAQAIIDRLVAIGKSEYRSLV